MGRTNAQDSTSARNQASGDSWASAAPLAPGALDGLRVVDMAAVVMGPYAAQILGDLGADVIKVEPPRGDMTRHSRPQRNAGMGALALNVNRNKRSLALDLKSAAGHRAALELIRGADVLITNTRPGALHRLGLDYGSVAGENPRLVYCSAQGFRSDSDRADPDRGAAGVGGGRRDHRQQGHAPDPVTGRPTR